MIFLNRGLPVTCVATFVLALGGCTADKVLFVTQTSLGVGFDAASARGHLGFDRQELLVSPDYPGGGHLPVASSVTTNLSFSAPQTKQFFATGDTALIASKAITVPPPIDVRDKSKTDLLTPAEKCSLNLGCAWSKSQERRQSVIAKNSHVGLVVSTKDAALATMDFGYGRQEAAYLPVQQAPGASGDVLPSALASIDVQTTTAPTGLTVSQFFASGAAADYLASNETVQDAFGTISQVKAVETEDAEREKAAAQLHMSRADFDTYLLTGRKHGLDTQKSIRTAVAKLLKKDADDDYVLSAQEQDAIARSLATLPGFAAGDYKASVTTAGDFRAWLNRNDRAAAAFIAQQST